MKGLKECTKTKTCEPYGSSCSVALPGQVGVFCSLLRSEGYLVSPLLQQLMVAIVLEAANFYSILTLSTHKDAK